MVTDVVTVHEFHGRCVEVGRIRDRVNGVVIELPAVAGRERRLFVEGFSDEEVRAFAALFQCDVVLSMTNGPQAVAPLLSRRCSCGRFILLAGMHAIVESGEAASRVRHEAMLCM